MRQEMRNLNRAKYAHSDEEMKQLASQGFVPVGQATASQAQASDDGGQSASQDQASDHSVEKKRKDTGRK